jgi:hypothetical protein
MHFNVENRHIKLSRSAFPFSFFSLCASPAGSPSSLVSMLKSDGGAYPRGVFTTDGDTTTFFVVERPLQTPIRPFDESRDPIARRGCQVHGGERGGKKHNDMKMRGMLN